MIIDVLKSWKRDDRASVAIEVGLLMPVMLTLLLGVVDVGEYICVDQKLINADQMVADLLTRNPTIVTSDLTNAFTAGQLTMNPYDTTSFGIDVAGIQFKGGPTQPQIQWRYTNNAQTNSNVPANTNNLGNDQDGVIVVTATYTYVPFFIGGMAKLSYNLQEVAIARGRNGLYIPKN